MGNKKSKHAIKIQWLWHGYILHENVELWHCHFQITCISKKIWILPVVICFMVKWPEGPTWDLGHITETQSTLPCPGLEKLSVCATLPCTPIRRGLPSVTPSMPRNLETQHSPPFAVSRTTSLCTPQGWGTRSGILTISAWVLPISEPLLRRLTHRDSFSQWEWWWGENYSKAVFATTALSSSVHVISLKEWVHGMQRRVGKREGALHGVEWEPYWFLPQKEMAGAAGILCKRLVAPLCAMCQCSPSWAGGRGSRSPTSRGSCR